jgi:Flp pilus assembly protein CpaB
MSDETPSARPRRRGPDGRNNLAVGVLVLLAVLLPLAAAGVALAVAHNRTALPTPTVATAAAPAMVEVIIAARDLPAGTTFAAEDLRDNTLVINVRMSKGSVPPTYVVDREELVAHRLLRPVRAGEVFDPHTLAKIEPIKLPEGHSQVTLELGGMAGFADPGDRVNVLATLRSGRKLVTVPVLVNVLVVAVDAGAGAGAGGPGAATTVSFALTAKQAKVLTVAKSRGWTLELTLRNPAGDPDDKDYDIDEVLETLGAGKAPGEAIPPRSKPETAAPVAPPPRPVGEPN